MFRYEPFKCFHLSSSFSVRSKEYKRPFISTKTDKDMDDDGYVNENVERKSKKEREYILRNIALVFDESNGS